MKKTFTNYEIDTIITTLSDQSSFIYDRQLKLPQSDRQAIRLNLATLRTVHNAYLEGRNDINMSYVESGRTEKQEDGSQKIKQEYMSEFQNEMIELLTVKTEVDIQPLTDEGLNKILSTNLSMTEEDVVLLFKEEPGTTQPETTEETQEVSE